MPVVQGILGALRRCKQLELCSCSLNARVLGLLAGQAATLTDLVCRGHPGRVCINFRV
jgi:hypothetical protein